MVLIFQFHHDNNHIYLHLILFLSKYHHYNETIFYDEYENDDINIHEGATYRSVDFEDNFSLSDGSFGIDAGIESFEFEPLIGFGVGDWSQNWPESEQDAFEYDYFENHDSFSGSAPDLGWTESEYIGVPFCDDLLSSNYEPEGTYLDCEYNYNYAVDFSPDNNIETFSYAYSEPNLFLIPLELKVNRLRQIFLNLIL